MATSPFWDVWNIGLFSLVVLAMMLDVMATRLALRVPGAYEANPLALGYKIIPLKVAGGVFIFILAYVFHRTGHHALERVMPIIMALPSTAAGINNFRIWRARPKS